MVPPFVLGQRAEFRWWSRWLLPGGAFRTFGTHFGQRRWLRIWLRPKAGIPSLDNNVGASAVCCPTGAARDSGRLSETRWRRKQRCGCQLRQASCVKSAWKSHHGGSMDVINQTERNNHRTRRTDRRICTDVGWRKSSVSCASEERAHNNRCQRAIRRRMAPCGRCADRRQTDAAIRRRRTRGRRRSSWSAGQRSRTRNGSGRRRPDGCGRISVAQSVRRRHR